MRSVPETRSNALSGFFHVHVQNAPIGATCRASPCDVIQFYDEEASAQYLSHPISIFKILPSLSQINYVQHPVFQFSSSFLFAFLLSIISVVSALLLFSLIFDSTMGFPGEGPRSASKLGKPEKGRTADWAVASYQRLQRVKVSIWHDFNHPFFSLLSFLSH